jgi:hypothetical protein
MPLLLPFIEQTWRFEQLDATKFACEGPYGRLPACIGAVSVFICPSDPTGQNAPGAETPTNINTNTQIVLGMTEAQFAAQYGGQKLTMCNYVFSMGDRVRCGGRPIQQQNKKGQTDARSPYYTVNYNPTITGGSWDANDWKEVANWGGDLSSARTFESITDGLSNTIFMSERGILNTNMAGQIKGSIIANIGVAETPAPNDWTQIFPQDCLNTRGTAGNYVTGSTYLTRSSAWEANYPYLYFPVCNRFCTVLPPNSPSCVAGTSYQNGAMLSANAHHRGGVNAVLGDGSVRFISETINSVSNGVNLATVDAGDPSAVSGQSPFGIWGALGSIDGGEATSVP